MKQPFISLHAAARDEVQRAAAVAAALGRHTRRSVEMQLAQPADTDPPVYTETAAALSQDGEQR